MKQDLIQEINERSRLVKEFCNATGVKEQDIPQELLDEIWGGPDAAAPFDDNAKLAKSDKYADFDWTGHKGESGFKPSTYRGREGDPRTLPQGGQQAGAADQPAAGDFIVVGGKPSKVSRVESKFGNTFAYVDGYPKPIMIKDLSMDKEVGGRKVFVSPHH